MNETDAMALAREALETYKVDEWPTMCALAKAVLDKDAQIRQIAHAQVAYAPPFCFELLKELQASRDMWQNGHMELRSEIEKRDARIKELEATLAEAAGSLFSYDQSYGGGGGQEECLEIARLLGYKDDAMPDEYLPWLRMKYTDACAALEGKKPE